MISGRTALGIPLPGGRLISVEVLYAWDGLRYWVLDLRLNPKQYHLLTLEEACTVIKRATEAVERGHAIVRSPAKGAV